MNRTCKFCNKQFVVEGKNSWKKIFCNILCQQAFWSIKRNKTGEIRKESRDAGKEIRRQNIHLSPEQLQIVYGTMMGDASISPRENGACRIQISHCEKQLPYLQYKIDRLSPFFIQEHPTPDSQRASSFKGSTPAYKYSSMVHQDFTDVFGLFYKTTKGIKRKIVDMNILNKLEPLSILFWFLDDGCYTYQPKKSTHIMFLSTYNCTLAEHRTLKRWFWHKWRIESTITHHKPTDQYTLRFPKQAQIIFNNLFLKPFKHLVPSCMHYKFPEF